MNHIICYSGGHSSAKVAMNVAKKYPNDKIYLLNHDINSNVEHPDIKRFKAEVAAKLGLEITFANIDGIIDPDKIPDQFDVCSNIRGFKFGNGTELCTYNLKTKPFAAWLDKHFPASLDKPREDVTIYYGFDKDETKRIQRRSGILAAMGYTSDYPLALWDDADLNIVENSGIKPPLTYQMIDTDNSYGNWKHANCIGCLKAGKQHWYAVYASRRDIWEKAKATEEDLDHSIIRGTYLDDLEPMFEEMLQKGIPPTEHIDGRTFWASVRRVLKETSTVYEQFTDLDTDDKPCECVI